MSLNKLLNKILNEEADDPVYTSPAAEFVAGQAAKLPEADPATVAAVRAGFYKDPMEVSGTPGPMRGDPMEPQGNPGPMRGDPMEADPAKGSENAAMNWLRDHKGYVLGGALGAGLGTALGAGIGSVSLRRRLRKAGINR